MAYDKTELFEKAKQIIQNEVSDQRILFIEDLIAFLPCGKTTFYNHFPPGGDEMNTLKGLIEYNRVKIKTAMRGKWYESENATLQVALMKLICTDEEAHRLNGSVQKVDVTTRGDKVGEENRPIIVTVQGIPKSELKENGGTL